MTAAELLEQLRTELVEETTARVLAELQSRRDDVAPGWLSVKGAAAYLDVSEERIKKQVAHRAIPFAQEGPGCRIFLERRALDQWMRTMQTPARKHTTP